MLLPHLGAGLEALERLVEEPGDAADLHARDAGLLARAVAEVGSNDGGLLDRIDRGFPALGRAGRRWRWRAGLGALGLKLLAGDVQSGDQALGVLCGEADLAGALVRLDLQERAFSFLERAGALGAEDHDLSHVYAASNLRSGGLLGWGSVPESNPTVRRACRLQGSREDLGGQSNMQKDPEQWTTGDEPMTGAQRSYLKTLCEEAKVPFEDKLTKA